MKRHEPDYDGHRQNVRLISCIDAGIAIGIIGIILVCLAYPIYNRTLRKEREKAAPEKCV